MDQLKPRLSIGGIVPALRGGAMSIALLVVATSFACADNGTDGGGAGTGFGGASGIGGAGVAGASGMTGASGAAGMAGGGAGMAGAGGMAGGAAGTGGAGGMSGGFVPGSPTWSAIWQETIVATGCGGGALCHGGMVGMLQMIDKDATRTALVGVPAMGMNLTGMPPHCADSGLMRVAPGNPDMSLLVRKVEQMMPGCGTIMPPNPPMLTAAQQMQIRMWIANGAMDN